MYVPPHRKKAIRRKVAIVPVLNGKYIMVQNKTHNQLTFIGGGCGNGKNNRQCAYDEMFEESRGTLKRQNFSLKDVFGFNGNRKLEGHNNKGQNIVSRYRVFMGTPTRRINFNRNVRNKFHATNVSRLAKKFRETSNIKRATLNNLNKMLPKNKYYIVNIIKNQLRRNNTRKGNRW